MANPHAKVVIQDGWTVKDALVVMRGMREHGIASLKLCGLELALAPTVLAPVQHATAASSMVAPKPQPSVAQAYAAIEQAKIEKAIQTRTRLERLKAQASSGHGLGTSALVEGVYEAAMATRPPTA